MAVDSRIYNPSFADDPVRFNKLPKQNGGGPLTRQKLLYRVIGQGVAFPFRFKDEGGTDAVNVANGFDKINQAIYIILTTRRGERVNRPTFGSRLPELVFEPNDPSLLPILEYETAQALREWESRITVTNVSFITPGFEVPGGETFQTTGDKNTIGIVIQYVVRRTNQPGSYVFPFKTSGVPFSENIPNNFARTTSSAAIVNR